MKKNNKQPQELIAPKGMRDIIGDEYYKYQGLFEKAQEIALYYGFKPIETPTLEKEELFARGVGTDTDIVEKEMYTLRTKGGDRLVLRPEGTASVMRAYMEHGMQTWTQPVLLYYSGAFYRHENPQKGRLRQFHQFGLEILGTNKAIADALTIRTTLDILEEAGLKNMTLLINSIGDNECRPSYIKALTNYYKKHHDKLCAVCKERLKTNPVRLLDCKNEGCIALKEDAPQSIASLCSGCKAHFKEVLEFLDSMELIYTIDHTLVRGLDYYTRTVFEIKESIPTLEAVEIPLEEGKEKTTAPTSERSLTIAGGGRYDNLSKALGSKKSIPAVGAALGMERIVELEHIKHPVPRILKKPKVYFIQLGFEARLKSIAVIEILRKAHVPIAQSITKDTLSSQLAIAEKMGIPYTVIFGQKEALEGTVIVRNMQNRSQDTVKIKDLAEYIKNIK